MRFQQITGDQSLQEAGLLQAQLDFLKASTVKPNWTYEGGVIELGRGDIYGNLIIDAGSVDLRGEGDGTVLHGSLLVRSGRVNLERLTIRGTGQPFAVKLFKSNAGIPRVTMKHCILGAASGTSGDGPVRTGGVGNGGSGGHGLWLDGAILGEFRKCIFAFCPGSGVFVDTSSVSPPDSEVWSTNVNEFYGCTANLNGRWGVEIVGGGIGGFAWYGGNIESNGTDDGAGNPFVGGAFNATNCNDITIRGTDFENQTIVATLIDMANVNPMSIENCIMSTKYTNNTAISKAQRAIILAGCLGKMENVRGTGFVTNHDWVAISETCTVISENVYHTTDDTEGNERRFVNNRGGRPPA